MLSSSSVFFNISFKYRWGEGWSEGVGEGRGKIGDFLSLCYLTSSFHYSLLHKMLASLVLLILVLLLEL